LFLKDKVPNSKTFLCQNSPGLKKFFDYQGMRQFKPQSIASPALKAIHCDLAFTDGDKISILRTDQMPALSEAITPMTKMRHLLSR